MRRILLVFSVAALMATMMVASALPAFAVADPNANARGEGASTYAPLSRADFGDIQSEQAQTSDDEFGYKNFGEKVKAEAQSP